MENNKERRYIDRVELPLAQIYYRPLDRYTVFRNYHGPLDLADISKSAMRIYGKLVEDKNIAVEIKLVVPGFSRICMKCRIMGFDERNTCTIVQFLPFGIGRNYNTFRAKEKLEQLVYRPDGHLAHLNLA